MESSSSTIRFTPPTPEKGVGMLRDACRNGEEGIVAKRLDSTYSGERSGSWLKIKCSGRQEFVIGGFTEPQGSRVGFGALLVGYYDDGQLRFAGKVGTGFDSRTLVDLHHRLKKLEIDKNPFANNEGRERGAHFVEPKLVAEIAYAEWTQNHMLRQPRFQGLREDKNAKLVHREDPAHLVGAAQTKGSAKHEARMAKVNVKTTRHTSIDGNGGLRLREGTRSRSAKPQAANEAHPLRVNFTHLDKLMFPDADVTKGDLLEFYAQIAPQLLPHLRDRPITIERLPDGLNGPRFWQKNTPTYYPSWIPRVEIPTVAGKKVQYALVNDLETLLYFVNQGTITFHVYLSRVKDLEKPDDVLFDLDPGESTFANVVTIAKKIHAILRAEKIESFPKTSGKSGLHILAPWHRKGGYDDARRWAMRVAAEATAALPKIATTERSLAARGGRVYLDVMQNAMGKHVVPPYVVRVVPEATVSTPLQWSEVTARLNPKKFDMKIVLKRAAKKPDLGAS